MPSKQVISWLLDSDPALRWQVERDLLSEPPEVWEVTAHESRRRVSARVCLPCRTPDGRWAGGAFFAADFDSVGAEADDRGQPWTATTWSLNSLREWDLDPSVLRRRRTAELLAETCRWEYKNLPYWGGEVDCCINAWTVANGGWLGVDVTGISIGSSSTASPTSGWNCEWVEGSARSSFHSTLNSLKGLDAYEAAVGGTAEMRAARLAGEEYLLRRGLFRRLATGDRWRRGWTASATHSGGYTACSTPPTTSGRRRRSTTRPRIPA